MSITEPNSYDIANLVDCAARLMQTPLHWELGSLDLIEPAADGEIEGTGQTALDMVKRWLQ